MEKKQLYHYECLESWYNHSIYGKVCPICKYSSNNPDYFNDLNDLNKVYDNRSFYDRFSPYNKNNN